MEVNIKSFGRHKGIEYDEIEIHKENQFKISFTDLGARIIRWSFPIESNSFENIILGYKNAAEVFSTPNLFFGATIGRVAGRISKGQFALNDQNYQLTRNDNGNHLHGGSDGLDLKKWSYHIQEYDNRIEVEFSYIDKDGQNGYPGTLRVIVTHTVYSDNKWTITYQAKTNITTICNLTNHVYFNLNGDNQQSIRNHFIQIDADYYLPIDQENLPIGMLESVENTPFNLKKSRKFSELLKMSDPQFDIHKGFDHPFILNKSKRQVVLENTRNPLKLLMHTTEPSVVVHTHNEARQHLHVWNNPLEQYAGIALETQKEPDAINRKKFHSIILEPEELYFSETTYQIETE